MRMAARRVVGLALIVLLLASVIGLAGSKTFVNKTGKTVTGITITFSRSVTVTRHDSVFPDQSPSGRSDEFTFSGRDLRNLGRFSITWMPSSGKVADYEWIEKAQPAPTTPTTTTQQEEEFKLPDPNTPPILYGDDYPDPEEPLYQPKEDEQIWLTDLEGHGDIYDNDSIKINYAPGFDKSQITKINVYRNGVIMRFLPDTFDVLTNAQMKTFDGNRLEHSPASAHTDHAIMGYEYEFKIISADHLWIMKKTVKSGFRWRPKEVWASLGFGWNWKMIDNMPLERIVHFLKYLKEDGFTGVSINVVYYMNTPYDNEVFAVYNSNSHIINWDITTPTNSELEKMLMAGTESGMEIHVRGIINISQKYQDTHGFTWCSQIDPADPERFFDSYTELWLQLMPILNTHHVKLVTPFTEMPSIEKYPTLIKRMYTETSNAYEGEMGFEGDTGNILRGTSAINGRPIHTSDAFRRIVQDFTFWDWRDSKGRPIRIEYSLPNLPVEAQKDQRVSVMTPAFAKVLEPAVDYYSSAYPQDPQMFGELVANNVDGQSLGSTQYSPSQMIMDEQERADYILAALEGSKALGTIVAINLWGDFYTGDFAPRLGYGSISTGHYSYPASPMYRTIKAIIQPAD